MRKKIPIFPENSPKELKIKQSPTLSSVEPQKMKKRINFYNRACTMACFILMGRSPDESYEHSSANMLKVEILFVERFSTWLCLCNSLEVVEANILCSCAHH